VRIKDPLLLGGFAGLIGNAVKLAGNIFNAYVLKISSTTYAEIAAGIFMTKKERRKKMGLVVGSIADLAIGALLGIPVVYFLRYTGKDHAVIKGLGYGHFAWVLFYGALGSLFGAQGVFPLNASTNLSAIINHSLYGMTTAAVISKFGDPSLFPEPGGGCPAKNSTEQGNNMKPALLN
jgi:hypothetical protein